DVDTEDVLEAGKHEIVLYDVKDTANQYPANASVLSGNYTVSDEVAAPEVQGIEALNANKFFIYTDQLVDLAEDSVTVTKGNHEFPNESGDKATEDDSVYTEVDTHPENNRPGIFVVVTDGNGDNPLYKGNESSVNLNV